MICYNVPMEDDKAVGLTNKIDSLFDTLDGEIKKFLDEILKREQNITERLRDKTSASFNNKDELKEIKKTKRKIKKLELDAIRDAIKEAMELKNKEENC